MSVASLASSAATTGRRKQNDGTAGELRVFFYTEKASVFVSPNPLVLSILRIKKHSMIRELVSRFSVTWVERRASVRKKYEVPVKVYFAPEKNPLNLTASCQDLFLAGETVDLSETGVGFVVSSIRIKEKYLVGQDRILTVELDLAGKKVRMQ